MSAPSLLWLRVGPLWIPVPHPGRLDAHDLHHRALGVGVDVEGEAVVSAFELRTGPPTLGIAMLCVGAIALGLLCSPRSVVRAWRAAAGCRNTYRLSPVERSALAAVTVTALRDALRIRRINTWR